MNKIELLARLIRKKKKITTIRNDRCNITTDSTDTKRKRREYYKQLHANILTTYNDKYLVQPKSMLLLLYEELHFAHDTLLQKQGQK